MCPDVVEYEQAYRRGQIALFARAVDLCNQLRHCCPLGLRDFLQAAPERAFEAHAGLVSVNDDGAFGNRGYRGFHRTCPSIAVIILDSIQRRRYAPKLFRTQRKCAW